MKKRTPPMQTIRDAATLLLLLMLVASIKITPLAELSEADMDWTTAEAASLETAPATEPALAALGRRRVHVVGAGNRLNVLAPRFLPRNVIANGAARMLGRLDRTAKAGA